MTARRTTGDWLERLLDHLEWANGRALDAIREGGGVARQEEDLAQVDGARGPLRLMAHVLGAEQVWLERIRTGDSAGLEIWPALTASECAELIEMNVRGFRRVLAGATEEDLGRPVRYENTSGTEYETPLGEILLQVFLHGEHHRGQIARELRRAGAEPVNTDVITFVRQRPSSSLTD